MTRKVWVAVSVVMVWINPLQTSPKQRLEAKLWANECVWCWVPQLLWHWHVIHALLKYSRDDRTSADRSWQQVQCTSIWRSISSPRKTSYCRWAKASSICRPFITSSVRASPTNSCWSTVSVSHVQPRKGWCHQQTRWQFRGTIGGLFPATWKQHRTMNNQGF